MCIDIVEIWFAIANGLISSIFDRDICSRLIHIFKFRDDKLSKYQWIFTNLGKCIDIIIDLLGIASGQISLNFDKSYLPTSCSYFLCPEDNLSKCQWIFIKPGIHSRCPFFLIVQLIFDYFRGTEKQKRQNASKANNLVEEIKVIKVWSKKILTKFTWYMRILPLYLNKEAFMVYVNSIGTDKPAQF